MKILIISMDDPLYINHMIKSIIKKRKKNIVGYAYVQGSGRLVTNKKESKIVYLCSLLLIMGFFYFIKNVTITINHKVKLFLSKKIKWIKSPLVLQYAKENNIKTFLIKSPNNKSFLDSINELQPDIIINQSMSILKKDLLSIPKIGVLNRHNALLPRNRGRLTPFWVLYKKELKTGVSIHFVEEAIDSGDIVIQKEYRVEKKDTFQSIVNKNYRIADKAMLEAIDKIQSGDCSYIKNDDNLSSYNSLPTFKQALKYRINRLLFFK